MIHFIITIILAVLLVLENIFLLLFLKRTAEKIKQETAHKFIECFQAQTGQKLSYKQEKRLYQALSGSAKNKK